MTTLYLDTEFNGFGGGLISMALVATEISSHDFSSEFYEVLPLPTFTDTWVHQNVLPVLNRQPIPEPTFRSILHQFLGQFDNPEIICDWHADAQHFCAALQGRSYGQSLDWPFTLRVLKTPKGFSAPSEMPHNALADARGLMQWHQSLSRDKAA